MASLVTPLDFGNTIRQRRKALGWDQARLAHEIGVSRQWVIDMEKGKPRAELHLVLRALKAMDLRLVLDGQSRPAPIPAYPDPIDVIVDRYKFNPTAERIPGAQGWGQPDPQRLVKEGATSLARRAALHLADPPADYGDRSTRDGDSLPFEAGSPAHDKPVKTPKAHKLSSQPRDASVRPGKKPRQ